MRMLFIAPLPPPITGHSLVSKALCDDLVAKGHAVDVVDLSKDSFKEGVDGVRRILEVGAILVAVARKARRSNVIYLTISESLAGNLKDLFIYLVCARSLSRIYVHLHGGSIKRQLWDRYPVLYGINRFFLSRIGGAIISGESHGGIFKGLVSPERIHIVPNFAPEALFASEPEVTRVFSATSPLRFLYVSSMKPRKGCDNLLEAFLTLPDEIRSEVRLDFAGRFDSPLEEAAFRNRIEGLPRVRYHGVVDDAQKAALFREAHVFCLPTSYFEGQPISILEAYASGCAVLTTCPSGILDIFAPGVNGMEIEAGSVTSIAEAIRHLVERRGELLGVALANRAGALKHYRRASFTESVRMILESDDRIAPSLVESAA